MSPNMGGVVNTGGRGSLFHCGWEVREQSIDDRSF